MPSRRLAIVGLLAVCLPGSATGQGIATATVRGVVRMADGRDADGAAVTVRSRATGYAVTVEVRRGRFLVQGLLVGGPYELDVRRIGARPLRRTLGLLSLAEGPELVLELDPLVPSLDSLVVSAPAVTGDGGIGVTIGDSLLHHLPTLDRDLYDFVPLASQISTRVGLGSGGLSAGGASFRFNHFLTDGVPERSLAGNQPSEFAGGKSLPFEAVSQYQVLVTPFDVRYGDFAGAVVNTVTRAGTNDWQGSALAQFRNGALGSADQPYRRRVAGAMIAGPVVRDRLHVMAAAELQRFTAPMAGPFTGAPAGTPAVPVRPEDLARLDALLRGYGLAAGTGGEVRNRNPVSNLFLRMDGAVPGTATRATVWTSIADARNLAFARSARDSTFALTGAAGTTVSRIRTAALQLNTALNRRGGGYNELLLSGRWGSFGLEPELRQPIISVAAPAAGGGIVSLVTGAPAQAHGVPSAYHHVDLRDNLTLSVGAGHAVAAGIEAEWFHIEPGGPAGAWGSWSFLSLDSLAAGLPDRYEVTRDLGGAAVPLVGAQYAIHVGDRWSVTPRLSVTAGLRADWLVVDGGTPRNAVIDSILGVRTDQTPGGGAQLSPRVGFTWDAGQRDRIRGGAGIFTGRPPLAWLHTVRRGWGYGVGVLRCGASGASLGPVPAFVPDPDVPPAACGNGAGTTPPGDVELAASDLRMARSVRVALAWDRVLGPGLTASVEALFTRFSADFQFVNRNLSGPQGTDRHGRVLYGAIDPLGRASPALRSPFPSVIELRNTGANRAAQLSARLERRFQGGSAVTASYTWSRVRDLETPLRINTPGSVNWAARLVSGRHDDPGITRSLNDIPHRIVVAATVRLPWRWATDLSLLYLGESGSPFAYRTFGQRGLGDLNADGSGANDPIYVPRDARDPDEIRFSGESTDPGADQSPAARAARIAEQGLAFERFIEDSPCLRRQRGRIVERNSCREPWSHTTVLAIRQALPVGTRGLELQLDLYNLLNLIDSGWGLRQVAAPAVLEHVGQAGPPGQSEPVFRFRATGSAWDVLPAESAFQFQFGVRYRF